MFDSTDEQNISPLVCLANSLWGFSHRKTGLAESRNEGHYAKLPGSAGPIRFSNGITRMHFKIELAAQYKIIG